tara:strand:+ start:210 stop:587 length:378 start_codon:yes stop_codon:yes gene_type:complete
MEREISTNGRKKVSTLMKEFNTHFPYLNLTKGSMGSDNKFYSCDINKTLSQVRLKKGSGEISFSGRKNVKTIEQEFDKIFGLNVQICWKSSDEKWYYTSGSSNSKSLTQLNREMEANGCKKDVWK